MTNSQPASSLTQRQSLRDKVSFISLLNNLYILKDVNYKKMYDHYLGRFQELFGKIIKEEREHKERNHLIRCIYKYISDQLKIVFGQYQKYGSDKYKLLIEFHIHLLINIVICYIETYKISQKIQKYGKELIKKYKNAITLGKFQQQPLEYIYLVLYELSLTQLLQELKELQSSYQINQLLELTSFIEMKLKSSQLQKMMLDNVKNMQTNANNLKKFSQFNVMSVYIIFKNLLDHTQQSEEIDKLYGNVLINIQSTASRSLISDYDNSLNINMLTEYMNQDSFISYIYGKKYDNTSYKNFYMCIHSVFTTKTITTKYLTLMNAYYQQLQDDLLIQPYKFDSIFEMMLKMFEKIQKEPKGKNSLSAYKTIVEIIKYLNKLKNKDEQIENFVILLSVSKNLQAVFYGFNMEFYLYLLKNPISINDSFINIAMLKKHLDLYSKMYANGPPSISKEAKNRFSIAIEQYKNIQKDIDKIIDQNFDQELSNSPDDVKDDDLLHEDDLEMSDYDKSDRDQSLQEIQDEKKDVSEQIGDQTSDLHEDEKGQDQNDEEQTATILTQKEDENSQNYAQDVSITQTGELKSENSEDENNIQNTVNVGKEETIQDDEQKNENIDDQTINNKNQEEPSKSSVEQNEQEDEGNINGVENKTENVSQLKEEQIQQISEEKEEVEEQEQNESEKELEYNAKIQSQENPDENQQIQSDGIQKDGESGSNDQENTGDIINKDGLSDAENQFDKQSDEQLQPEVNQEYSDHKNLERNVIGDNQEQNVDENQILEQLDQLDDMEQEIKQQSQDTEQEALKSFGDEQDNAQNHENDESNLQTDSLNLKDLEQAQQNDNLNVSQINSSFRDQNGEQDLNNDESNDAANLNLSGNQTNEINDLKQNNIGQNDESEDVKEATLNGILNEQPQEIYILQLNLPKLSIKNTLNISKVEINALQLLLIVQLWTKLHSDEELQNHIAKGSYIQLSGVNEQIIQSFKMALDVISSYMLLRKDDGTQLEQIINQIKPVQQKQVYSCYKCKKSAKMYLLDLQLCQSCQEHRLINAIDIQHAMEMLFTPIIPCQTSFLQEDHIGIMRHVLNLNHVMRNYIMEKSEIQNKQFVKELKWDVADFISCSIHDYKTSLALLFVIQEFDITSHLFTLKMPTEQYNIIQKLQNLYSNKQYLPFIKMYNICAANKIYNWYKFFNDGKRNYNTTNEFTEVKKLSTHLQGDMFNHLMKSVDHKYNPKITYCINCLKLIDVGELGCRNRLCQSCKKFILEVDVYLQG